MFASSAQSAKKGSAHTTVVREGGGRVWEDQSLLEWDPLHFRIFVGDLAGEVSDDALLQAFSKYRSVQKARNVRDRKSGKSRGYGFVSFKDPDDFVRALREMNGKYIGSRPIKLRKANADVSAVKIAPAQLKHMAAQAPYQKMRGAKTDNAKIQKNSKKKKSVNSIGLHAANQVKLLDQT